MQLITLFGSLNKDIMNLFKNYLNTGCTTMDKLTFLYLINNLLPLYHYA